MRNASGNPDADAAQTLRAAKGLQQTDGTEETQTRNSFNFPDVCFFRACPLAPPCLAHFRWDRTRDPFSVVTTSQWQWIRCLLGR